MIVQATYDHAGAVEHNSLGSQKSPLRREYPTTKMGQDELLSHLSKVRILQSLFVEEKQITMNVSQKNFI